MERIQLSDHFTYSKLFTSPISQLAQIVNNIQSCMASSERVFMLLDEPVEAEDKVENKSASVKVNMEQKMSYIENIDIGTIVAFRLSSGKVKSAKVTRKSTKNRKLKLETDYGAEYIVSYDDVVWVRTGKRWPRGVYKLLKGQVDANGEERIEA